MSAYNRGELSIEAYLVRIIAALCRQNGGELRVKGELVDTIGEATALMKAWDSRTQELVLTVSMGTFGEVFRVVPEKQAKQQILFDTAKTADHEPQTETPRATRGSTLDDPEKLAKMEASLRKRKFASDLKDQIRREARQETQ